MPFVVDFKCLKCESTWEAWLDTSEDSDPKSCPKCKSRRIKRLLGATITKCHDPVARNEILRKRSFEHTKKTASNNVERILETGR